MTRPPAEPSRTIRRWRALAVWLGPPLSVLALIYITPEVPETYRAWRGQGQAGHLQVESSEYGKRCRYFGPWTSDDGSHQISAAFVDDLDRDDCIYAVGDRISSIDVGDEDRVYVRGDYAFWFAAVITALACVSLGGTAIYWALRVSRRPSGIRQERL